MMPSSQTARRAAMLPSNDIGNVTAETQFKDGRGNLLQLPLDSNGTYSNKAFRVRVSGRVSTTSTVGFTLNVYFGISSNIGSNTLIFSSAQVTVDTTTSSFEMWLDCFWSADAQAITGRAAGQLANGILGPATLLNIPISADPNRDSNTFLASGTTYGFTLTGQFSGSSAGNHATVDAFDLETA